MIRQISLRARNLLLRVAFWGTSVAATSHCGNAAAALNTEEILVIVDDPYADSSSGKMSSVCHRNCY